MKRFLLKQKVAVLLIVTGLVAVLLTSGVIYVYINKTLVDNKKNEILYGSTEQAHESTLTFKNNQLFVYMLSTQTRVKDVLLDSSINNKNELTDLFNKYIEKDKKYLALFLLDKNGVGLVSTDPRFVGQDYSFRDYFKKAIKGEPSTDVLVGKTSKQFGYYFIDPVYGDTKEVLGVLILKVDENDINSPLVSSKISEDNILMLVDDSGIVVSSTLNDRKLKSLGRLSEDVKNKIIEGDRFPGVEINPLQYDLIQENILNYKSPTVLDIYDEEDKEKEIFSIVKLEELPFYIVTEIRLGDIDSQVFETVAIIISIIVIFLILISFFIFYFLKKFLKPLDKFISYFNSISNGNFSQELKVDTRDEFYDMADRVNKMAKDLSDLYKNLDQKVKEQTVDIENQIKESDDQNKAILNILEDVEEEKANAEKLASDLEKFKLAVDNVSDQIVITDKEGIVIYGNKAVREITGFDPLEAIGKKAGLLWKVPMSKEYYSNLWDIIKIQKKTFTGEIQNKRKNGELYTAIISISSVLNKDGEIVYFVAIEKDITKEKEIDKAKTEFVSLASHQLRTPLSAINWYTEMLLAGDAGDINEEQRKYLNEVSNGNKRMVDLVEDLLNVSRLDMGTFIGSIKDINILDLLKSVILEIKPQIVEKKLMIQENLDENIQIFKADEKLFRMIYQNLLSNAVKYTQPEGFVKISLFKVNKNEIIDGVKMYEDSLIFSVSDSGMGIPKEQQDKIFLKLFRADNAKESETEGTGLGLYVIKSIVDQSGGQVWFKSEINTGTTFYVSFPLSGMKVKEKLINY